MGGAPDGLRGEPRDGEAEQSAYSSEQDDACAHLVPCGRHPFERLLRLRGLQVDEPTHAGEGAFAQHYHRGLFVRRERAVPAFRDEPVGFLQIDSHSLAELADIRRAFWKGRGARQLCERAARLLRVTSIVREALWLGHQQVGAHRDAHVEQRAFQRVCPLREMRDVVCVVALGGGTLRMPHQHREGEPQHHDQERAEADGQPLPDSEVDLSVDRHGVDGLHVAHVPGRNLARFNSWCALKGCGARSLKRRVL
jgi:hypothetical protein